MIGRLLRCDRQLFPIDFGRRRLFRIAFPLAADLPLGPDFFPLWLRLLACVPASRLQRAGVAAASVCSRVRVKQKVVTDNMVNMLLEDDGPSIPDIAIRR